jgi:hypothetical protein
MNFITYMTWNGRPLPREVDFFETKEQAMAFCTTQNGLLAAPEAHYHVRALKDVF